MRPEGAPITAEGLVVYDPQWTKPLYRRNGYPGLITNGAYRLSDWTFKRRVRMAVNPFHRMAEKMHCRTVDMLVYENISAAIMAYEAGRVDFLPAMDVPYDHEIARLSLSGERKDYYLCPVLATYFLNFNCVSDEVNGVANPFVDRRVRKAFALALNKKGIVEQVLRRGDRVAKSFVPPDVISGYTPPSGLDRDVEAARQLLVEAGYPGGEGLPPIELLYTPSDELVSQALARMWEESLGVGIELRSRESKTFAEDKANHRFMVARGNWYADYTDPTTFLDCLRTGNGNNDSGYAGARYDTLLDRAEAEGDTDKRTALLRQAEAIVVEEDFPIVPILHYATPVAIKPYVSGLYTNARLWFPFQSVKVDR
jgi:oligopeptide transport system substrate-binding protein